MTENRRSRCPVRPWHVGLVLAVLLGALLRLLWGLDIEYKLDEEWTFEHTGLDDPWVPLGMPTSAGFNNPGLSQWVFVLLRKLCAAHDPVGLARAVQCLNVVALGLLVWFALRWVRPGEREPWQWAAALVALNPLAVLFHRKIWPPSVLPVFTLALLAGWWRRDRRGGAFLWGLVGALVGQVHLSGFFLAAGFALWAVLFDRKGVAWRAWLLGSCLGALPLLPWLHYLAAEGMQQPGTAGHWYNVLVGKFWLRWATEPFGLSVEYALEDDFGDYLGYPLLGGRPTYLVLGLHVLLAALAAVVLLRAGRLLWLNRARWRELWVGRGSATAFTVAAALWGFGLLLTASGRPIPRHYLVILFPLGFVWLGRLALIDPGAPARPLRGGRAVLLALCVGQFLVTASFLGYVHVNQRRIRGDYGIPYGAQNRDRPPMGSRDPEAFWRWHAEFTGGQRLLNPAPRPSSSPAPPGPRRP